MGTNFYWHHEICDHCSRRAETHVGKRSYGWSFAFQGHRHELLDPAHPDWGYNYESPVGRAVRSRADWREVFQTVPGRLFDEYGEEIADPATWLEAIEAPSAQQIAKEQGWMRGYNVGVYEDKSWRDPEGFRFDYREFS
jgi:hypothetical protein